jgi:hypothetical protein
MFRREEVFEDFVHEFLAYLIEVRQHYNVQPLISLPQALINQTWFILFLVDQEINQSQSIEYEKNTR